MEALYIGFRSAGLRLISSPLAVAQGVLDFRVSAVKALHHRISREHMG